jgi:putative ABC transport system permease protein
VFFTLAFKSLMSRKGSVVLAILAMAVSIFVLLGVEHVRHEAKKSFSKTVSGVDLIVGARTGSLNLLLYSVFRIGSSTNNISWGTFKQIAAKERVKWAIPISLGDSHKGYRVMGTTADYFSHYSYGRNKSIAFEKGGPFTKTLDVVLGAEVARALSYKIGDQLVLAHGMAATSFSKHDDHPFTVTGILAPTGTPIDRTLHVGLAGIEAIHIGWRSGVKLPSVKRPHDYFEEQLMPKSITAFFLGLETKLSTFQFQREINTYGREPLLAILPGVALSELWQMMGALEKTLLFVSSLVFLSAALGVCAMLLSSLRMRQQEIQLLRIAGASPRFVFFLIQTETLFIVLFSILIGGALLFLALVTADHHLVTYFGLTISSNFLSQHSLILIASVIAGALLAATLPAVSGYQVARRSQF